MGGRGWGGGGGGGGWEERKPEGELVLGESETDRTAET